MAKRDEEWTQLATRIPKSLHRQLKLHCVHTDTSLMEFVIAAPKAKLARQGRGGRRTRDEGGHPPRRSQAASLSAPMDRRAHLLMARHPAG